MRNLSLLLAFLLGTVLSYSAERQEITADDLTNKMKSDDKPLILDVRSVKEYEAGRLIGAKHIPFKEVSRRATELGTNKEKVIVVYCQSGYRAGKAEASLRKKGFTKVYHLIGDWGQWSKEKRPFISGKEGANAKSSKQK